MKFARPGDTYGGVIKIHVAFGYTEPAVLTPAADAADAAPAAGGIFRGEACCVRCRIKA